MSNVVPIRKPVPVKDRWLSPGEVCVKLPGMSIEVLAKRRKQGLRPDYFKPTGEQGRGAVFYLESEVDDWVMSSRVRTRT